MQLVQQPIQMRFREAIMHLQEFAAQVNNLFPDPFWVQDHIGHELSQGLKIARLHAETRHFKSIMMRPHHDA